MEEERTFTLDEANRLIPTLRTILKDAGSEWSRIKGLNPEVQKARDKAQYDGFTPYGAEYVAAVSQLLSLLRQVKEMGVLLKDIDQGLCDFPYMRQGRIVYLCWRLDESVIAYWHDIEAGFAGREPLDETDR
jgi:hypothetical protein